MRMTKTIFHVQPMPRTAAHSLALAAALVILVISVGNALAKRLEQRASADRLSIGDVAEN